MVVILLRILTGALALLAAAALIPGIEIESLYIALIAAVVLGLLTLIARPVLVILTLPITILTLGLFVFVINALLFLFAASFIEGFSVDGFIPALLGSLFVSIATALANRFLT